MLLGTLIGGALSNDKAAGALLGAMAGGLATKEQPVPLDRALRDAFSAAGATLHQIYRHGPHRVRVLFNYAGQFWTIESTAPQPLVLQDEIDDWLFGDLVDYQLRTQIEKILVGRP